MRHEPTASVLMGRDRYRPVVPSLESAGGFVVPDAVGGEPEPTIVIPDPDPNPEPAPVIPDPNPNPEPAPVIPDPDPNPEPAPVIPDPDPVGSDPEHPGEPAPAPVALSG